MPVSSTIVAVSTPPGEGGLGVVRMSGPRAIAIGRNLFRSRPVLGTRPRHVEYGKIVGPEGEPIDTGLAWAMPAPRTYTGEDTAEISCHGSQVVLEAVVEAAVQHGADLAGPGEFTRRAFCNDRIDLLQAEAVLDLIRSGSRLGLESAYGHTDGRLSCLVASLKHALVTALSRVEVVLDFSEEDIGDSNREHALPLIRRAAEQGRVLLDTFDGCRRRQDGIKVALIGRPNAGKSTLLNAMLGEDRAIVSAEPGTTRDLVEAVTYWKGEVVRIVDTAGLHAGSGGVEAQGIARARSAAANADLLLGVVDAGSERVAEDDEVLGMLAEKLGILVLNKIDLPRCWTAPERYGGLPCEQVSAITGHGLVALRDRAAALLPRPRTVDGVGITRDRHRQCLQRMVAATENARCLIEHGEPEECVAVELQTGLGALGDMLGEDVTEDVLDQIFADFCIGK